MPKSITLAVLFVLLLNECYSQIDFQEGYLIDNLGQRVDCLIKNVDWKNNPIMFNYKKTLDDSIQVGDLQTVSEFGVNGFSKYVRARVKMDRSGDNVSTMSKQRNPNFYEEEIFLKVLIEGEASLYAYQDQNLTRFFYQKVGSDIEQLVYKHYLVENRPNGGRNWIGENNLFRQQLYSALNCEAISDNKLQRIGYNKNELQKMFLIYNECVQSDHMIYENHKSAFGLSLRSGLNRSNLSIDNNLNPGLKDADFSDKLNFRLGLEAEIILPFYRNKWAVIAEPTYQYFVSETSKETFDVKVKYHSIELPFGVRHYWYLNNDSKIFLDMGYVIDIPVNSKVEYSYGQKLDIISRPNFAFGIGYKLKSRYSLEIQYQTGREILGDYLYWSSQFDKMAVVFGYSFIKNDGNKK